MTDMKQMHDFAVKWCDKFRNQNINFIELVDHFMADDCAAFGFEMDCGQGFSEKYGDAVDDHEALGKIINDVTDIPLLGSAIYSRWRYFNHWAYTGEEILEPQNRAWFVLALSRLRELADEQASENCNIILFPDGAKLKAEVEKLRTEMSMLLLERDELLFVECRNIETAYMLVLGNLEYKAYELHYAVLRLKRKTELIQAKKNRQEKVLISDIEQTLDAEFAEFKTRLDEKIHEVNTALKRSQGEFLSDEDTGELKKLYRSVVKMLHPDLHPDISEAQVSLFHSAVSAYENGDLNSLRIIRSLVSEPAVLKNKKEGTAVLAKEKKRLTDLLQILRDRISEIKNTYPYTMKALVRDEKKMAEKKTELEHTISQLQEVLELYKAKIEEMLR